MTRSATFPVALICTVALLLGGSCAYGAPVSASYTGWMWGDPTPQGDALSDVTFVGLRGYAVGEEGTVLRTDDGGNTWSGLASGTRQDLSRVQALDANTVLIRGLCTLRESTDEGASFQALPVDQIAKTGLNRSGSSTRRPASSRGETERSSSPATADRRLK